MPVEEKPVSDAESRKSVSPSETFSKMTDQMLHELREASIETIKNQVVLIHLIDTELKSR